MNINSVLVTNKQTLRRLIRLRRDEIVSPGAYVLQIYEYTTNFLMST